jgi:hypothetical protein
MGISGNDPHTALLLLAKHKIREEMPKAMHRGPLLLRIMPPYGIISSVMFLM